MVPWMRATTRGLAGLLLGAMTAQAQYPVPPAPALPPTPVPIPVEPVLETVGIPLPYVAPEAAPRAGARSGLEPESLPAELAEDFGTEGQAPVPRGFGPTPVADVRFLMDQLRLGTLFNDSGIRTFGWAEAGYSGASTGPGLLSVQPRQNRFGNEFLMNQIGLVIQKPLKQDQFDIGFNVRYFAGADAAIGQPKGGLNSPPGNPRFSHDFRDLYISAHLPIFTEGGMDVKVGRMNSIIGYNGFLSPYRPFYSSDYQFFYSQDGAFTGFLTNLHLTDRLDIWNGMTFGANTFFTKRSPNSINYIGQINYWLTEERKTRLTASFTCGPDAIFAAPGLGGNFDSIVELRVQQNWSERITQVIQSNMGWASETAVGTGSWYGLYTIGIFHITPEWDALVRAEWFDDVKGTRTGISTNYSEVTLGVNWHPTRCLEIRPEIRGDFASDPAFGRDGLHTDFSQLTGGVSALVKF